MGNIGPLELVVVLIIALVVLGPKRLPDAGRALGKGINEFKGALTGESRDSADEDERDTAAVAARPAPEREAERAPEQPPTPTEDAKGAP